MSRHIGVYRHGPLPLSTGCPQGQVSARDAPPSSRGSERRKADTPDGRNESNARLETGLVVSGLLNKQVGGELGISEITIEAHRGRVMEKMKARSFRRIGEDERTTGPLVE